MSKKIEIMYVGETGLVYKDVVRPGGSQQDNRFIYWTYAGHGNLFALPWRSAWRVYKPFNEREYVIQLPTKQAAGVWLVMHHE